MPVIMMSGHATIDTAVEATRIGATDFLEKPVGMQKLLAAVKKALEKDARTAAAGLLLDDFPRSAPLRDLKKRLDQMLAKRPLLLLRSMPGSIIELVMNGIHGPGKSGIDLAHDSQPLGVDQLERIQGGVLWCEELLRLTRLQQKNLAFAAERLERYALHLVVGTTHTPAELLAHGWDESVLNRLFETTLGVPGLIELRDEVPELSVQLLARAVASSEVPLRRLTTPALNALRQHAWHGGYAELRGIVKSLALGSLNEDIDEHDVRQLVMPNDQSEHTISAIDAAVLDLPLREAREIFERMYFNFHLQHDGSNMTRLSELTCIEN
jgi:DNA-binding NtrC family response regulator